MLSKEQFSSLGTDNKSRSKAWRQSLPKLLRALIVGLAPGSERESFVQGTAYGVSRRQQGASIDDIFDEFRALERAVYEVVQENLLAADVSNLVPDLRIFNDHVQVVLRHAVSAYLAGRAAA